MSHTNSANPSRAVSAVPSAVPSTRSASPVNSSDRDDGPEKGAEEESDVEEVDPVKELGEWILTNHNLYSPKSVEALKRTWR